jgi:hypothetical protein
MTNKHALLAALLTAGFPATLAAAASDAMPALQQTKLVIQYCAVCHNDVHLNGGLSLEHFDAAHADPGVAAMLVSKITSGVALEKIRAAQTDPTAAAIVAASMRTGAMGAAGIPVPDRPTQDALVHALSAEATEAGRWTVNRIPVWAASIAREVPLDTKAGEANTYRLTLTCRPDTHEGAMLLSWAPGVPKKGTAISAAVDGKAPSAYTVEDNEKVLFAGATGGSGQGAIPIGATSLPEQTLAIGNLFPGETVVFPFGELTPAMRQGLSPCFSAKN